MPECPFSRDRLAEIRWKERWPLTAIAAVATSACEETITPEIVLAWCEQLGIRADPPPRVEDVMPAGARAARSTSRPPAARAPREKPERDRKQITRQCAFCGADVTRYASEFTGKGEIAFCNAEEQRLYTKEKTRQKRLAFKAAKKEPELAAALGIAPAEKLCHGPCGLVKPITEFSLDVHRGDGRARVCLECNKQKSREYYERNRERQIAKARENKRKRAETNKPEED